VDTASRFSMLLSMHESIPVAVLVGATCQICGRYLTAEDAADASHQETVICMCGSREFRLLNGECLMDCPDA
jgi:hypothetical protein